MLWGERTRGQEYSQEAQLEDFCRRHPGTRWQQLQLGWLPCKWGEWGGYWRKGQQDLAAGFSCWVLGKEKNEGRFLGLGNKPLSGWWCHLLRWEEKKERTSLREKYQGFHFDHARSEMPITHPRAEVKLAVGHESGTQWRGQGYGHKFGRQQHIDSR